jgi:anti-anti-sigma factor
VVTAPQECFGLHTEESEVGTRVSFPGTVVFLDEAVTNQLGDQLFSLVEERGRCRLLLDFANVTFLTSGTLGMLLQLHKKLKTVGGRLFVCNVVPHIYEVFAVTNLTRLLNVRMDDGRDITV